MNSLFEKNLISTKEAGKFSGYASDYISRLVRSGKIQGRRIGHTWFVEHSSLEAFIGKQNDKKVETARQLSRAREQEYRAYRSPVRKTVRLLQNPLSVPAGSRFATEFVALGIASLVIGGGFYGAHSPHLLNAFGQGSEIAMTAASGFAENIERLGDDVAQIKQTEESRGSFIRAANKNRVSEAVAAAPRIMFPRITPISLSVDETNAVRSAENTKRSEVAPYIRREEIVRAARGIISLALEPRSALGMLAGAYVGMGETVYGAVVSAQEAYLGGIRTAGEGALIVGIGGRDAAIDAPGAILALVGGAIDLNARLAIGTSAAGISLAQGTLAFMGNVGDVLVTGTARMPDVAYETAVRISALPLEYAPKIAKAFFGAEMKLAQTVLAVGNGLASGSLAFVQGTGNLALGFKDSLDGASASLATAISELRASGPDALAAAAESETGLSFIQWIALSTYETVQDAVDSTSSALAVFSTPTSTVPIPDAAPQSTSSPSAPVSTKIANAPAPSSSAAGATPSFNTYVTGVSQEYVAASLQALRADLSNQMIALVAPVSRQVVTNVTTIQQVARIESLGGLAVSQGNFTNSTFDGGTIKNVNSIGGSNGTFGTLTTGGLTATANIVANGFSSASYFTATSTSATSTFAGAFAVGTTSPFGDSFLTIGSSTPLFHVTRTNGFVGIGTSSPVVTLDIYGTDAIRVPVGTTAQRPATADIGYVRFNTTTNQFEGYNSSSVWTNLGGLINAAQTTYATAGDDDYLRFITTNSERFTITNNGLIGVSSTTPYAQLSVHLPSNASTTVAFAIASSTANATTTLFNILNSGRVGIGTSSPSALLSVAGNSYLTGGLGVGLLNSTAGTLQTSGLITGGSTLTLSGTTGTTTLAAGQGFTIGSSQFVLQQGSGFAGIGTTSPWGLLSVNPTSSIGSAPAFVVGSSTATRFVVDNAGNVGIGTTSPSQVLSVSGNGYFTGGLGIGMSTTTAGDLAVANNAYIGGSLTIAGNNIVLGNSSSNTITVNSSVSSHFIPTVNAVYDLGSPSFYWDDAYIDQLNVNSISAASTTIGGTTDANFVLNSDNATADTEDVTLNFYRGTTVPNALLTWNSTRDRFEFNQPLYIENASSSTTIPTLALVGKSGQTGDLFNVASSSGSRYFTVDYLGNVGVGTTSPGTALGVTGAGVFTGTLTAPIFTATSTLAASTFPYASTTALTVSGTAYLGSLTGPLQAISGAVSASSTISVAYGGTGVTSFGGTNTLLYTSTANTLSSITTANSSILITNGSGVPSWGTTLPAYTLGGAVTGNSQSITGLSQITVTGTTATSTFSTGGLTVGTSQFVVQQNSGNVGIGNTTPGIIEGTNFSDVKFHVTGRAIAMTGTYNEFIFDETDQASGSRVWDLLVDSGKFNIRRLGDIGSVGSTDTLFTIDRSTGNVGIGTTSPTHTLSVAGDLNYTGTLYQNGVALGVSQWTTSGSNIYYNTGSVSVGSTTPWGLLSVNPTAANGSAPSFVVGSSTATRFIIDNGGSVGVAASSPNARLEVSDSGTSHNVVLKVTQDDENPLGLVVGNDTFSTSDTDGLGLFVENDGTAELRARGTNAEFQIDVAGSKAFKILNGGKVGIGTTSPFAQLSVHAAAGTNSFAIGSSTATYFTVGSTGNVGIGTSNPQHKLNVYGGSSDGAQLRLTGDNGNLGIELVNATAGTYNWRIGAQNIASNFFEITPSTAVSGTTFSTPALGIAGATSFVGVGTTSPFARLSIHAAAGETPFAIGSSTATSFRVDPSGNVGVGPTATSLSHLLTVSAGSGLAGSLRIFGSSNDAFISFGDNTDNWSTGIDTSDSSKFKISRSSVLGSSDIVTINSSGFVGVGTTSPWALLSVNPTSAIGTAAAFAVGSSTATRFVIDNGGLVGIGTSSPSTRLSVQDTVSTAQLRVAYDTTRYADLQVNSSGDLLLASQSTNIYTTDGNLFACASGACPSGTVSGTGNIIAETRIGIGTSTPSVQLDIVASTPTIRLRDSATTTGFSISQNSNGTTTLNNIANAEIVFGTNNTTRMVITQSGHVGIGTTSPTQQFSVADRLFVGANGASGLGTATSTFQGDLKITGKLDVGTIDPVYTIDGVKYATYGHSTVGIKEETVATFNLDAYNSSTRTYQHVIKFSELPKGSDLWLFYQITDFGSDWEHLIVSLTPGFDGAVSYRKLPDERVLVVESTRPGEVTARMLANRFNWREWPTLRPDQDTPNDTGFVLSSKK